MNSSQIQAGNSTPTASSSSPLSNPPHPSGFVQSFGLHPAASLLTLAIDSMLFGEEVITAGLGVILSLPVGAAVGFLTFMLQQKWFHDDKDSAAIKGGIVALLTAIPTVLPSAFYLGAGVLGLFRRKN